MRIIIDADACPRSVRSLCKTLADSKNIAVIMVADREHNLDDEADDDVSVLLVDVGRDESDYRIVQIAEASDLVVTGDYGLAAILLDRVTAVLHPDGFVYNHANIDTLLYSRYLNAKARKNGHFRRIRRRTEAEDAAFAKVLNSYLKGFDTL